MLSQDLWSSLTDELVRNLRSHTDKRSRSNFIHGSSNPAVLPSSGANAFLALEVKVITSFLCPKGSRTSAGLGVSSINGVPDRLASGPRHTSSPPPTNSCPRLPCPRWRSAGTPPSLATRAPTYLRGRSRSSPSPRTCEQRPPRRCGECRSRSRSQNLRGWIVVRAPL